MLHMLTHNPCLGAGPLNAQAPGTEALGNRWGVLGGTLVIPNKYKRHAHGFVGENKVLRIGGLAPNLREATVVLADVCVLCVC